MAVASGVSIPTVKRLEAVDGDLGGRAATGEKIIAALESAGVEFIPENGGGAGVRLRKGKAAADHTKPSGPATDLVGEMNEAIDKDKAKERWDLQDPPAARSEE